MPIDSMLKLLVYAKIEHMGSAKYIADMAMYHEVYRFVSDDVKPSEHSIQRHRREYSCYFEVLLQMTLKKASDLKLTDFNHIEIDGTIKKAYNSNNNAITKKKKPKYCSITSNGLPVSQKILEKLHKPAQKILENKDMDVEDKIELLYGIETQFTFTEQDKIPVNDIEARFIKKRKKTS